MALLALVAPASAGMQVITQVKAYHVSGNTPRSIVSFMDQYPFQGDHGEAWASIHPDYDLTVSTTSTGGACRASDVGLTIDFTETLPVGDDRGSMSPRTRADWDGFAAFAARHEGYHKAVYVDCARQFVAAARRQTADTCFALNLAVRQQLEDSKQACETQQLRFDQEQHPLLQGLALFREAP